MGSAQNWRNRMKKEKHQLSNDNISGSNEFSKITDTRRIVDFDVWDKQNNHERGQVSDEEFIKRIREIQKSKASSK